MFCGGRARKGRAHPSDTGTYSRSRRRPHLCRRPGAALPPQSIFALSHIAYAFATPRIAPSPIRIGGCPDPNSAPGLNRGHPPFTQTRRIAPPRVRIGGRIGGRPRTPASPARPVDPRRLEARSGDTRPIASVQRYAPAPEWVTPGGDTHHSPQTQRPASCPKRWVSPTSPKLRRIKARRACAPALYAMACRYLRQGAQVALGARR